MRSKIRITFASLALILGIGHLAYGGFAYKAYSLELLWFCGTGIAIIVTALANFRPNEGGLTGLQNAVMLSFSLAIAAAAPLPQVWAAVILFSGLFVISMMDLRRA